MEENAPLYFKVIPVVILIFSIILHEIAHGVAALLCGDTTAKEAGRLSLNPIKHIDIFGSIILPAILVITNAGFWIGWAKPVPINPNHFKNYNVIFLTAIKLNEIFLTYHTSSIGDKQAIFSLLTTCDLLVIDDLGTEPILKNVTVESLTATLALIIVFGYDKNSWNCSFSAAIKSGIATSPLIGVICMILSLAVTFVVSLLTKKPSDDIIYEAFEKSFEGEIK